MKLKFSILTIILINLSNAQIKNPGFENSINDSPDKWNVKNVDSYVCQIDNSQKYQGKNSFKITGNSINTKIFQSFFQKIPLSGKGIRKI